MALCLYLGGLLIIKYHLPVTDAQKANIKVKNFCLGNSESEKF